MKTAPNTTAIVITSLLLVVFGTPASHAHQAPPLRVADVVVLLESGLTAEDVIEQIAARGMAPVELDEASIKQLREANTDDTGENSDDHAVALIALQIAEAFLGRGEIEIALEHLQLASQLVPQQPAPLIRMAEVFRSIGDYRRALDAANEAVKVAPQNADVFYERYSCHVSLGNFQQALKDTETVTKLAPDFFDGYRLMALLLAASPIDEMRDGPRAVQLAQKAIELAKGSEPTPPHAFWLLFTLAAALAETGQFDQAVAVQTEAVAVAPEGMKPFASARLQDFSQGTRFRLQPADTDPADERPPRQQPVINIVQQLQQNMVAMEGGAFRMGSEKFREFEDERPVHEVEVTPFYLSRYEVTNREYALVMLGTSHFVANPDNPVESVSWADCQEFIRRLNEMAGANLFRLPTEAEWEYAARAGTTTEYFFGDEAAQLVRYAWFEKNSDARVRRVGQRAANPWGLFDIYGNVGEWCQNGYQPYPLEEASGGDTSLRVFRGGSWANSAHYCRSSARSVGVATDRLKGVGFRLAMDAAGEAVSGEGAQQNQVDLQELDEAVDEAEEAYRNSKDSQNGLQLVQLLQRRGVQRYEAGNYMAAVEDLERALLLMIDHGLSAQSAFVHALLAWIWATCPEDGVRDGEKAVEIARKACGLTHWNDWAAYSCLAAAYAEAGRFDRAEKRQADAMHRAPEEHKQLCRERLGLYQSEKPLRTDEWP